MRMEEHVSFAKYIRTVQCTEGLAGWLALMYMDVDMDVDEQRLTLCEIIVIQYANSAHVYLFHLGSGVDVVCV